MNKELQQKLEEILDKVERNGVDGAMTSFPIDEAIAQIDVAYQSEGYVKQLVEIPLFHQDLGKEPTGSGAVIMTGDEFYQRFEKELQKQGLKVFTPEEQKIADELGKEVVAMRQCMKVAQRAAGISE